MACCLYTAITRTNADICRLVRSFQWNLNQGTKIVWNKMYLKKSSKKFGAFCSDLNDTRKLCNDKLSEDQFISHKCLSVRSRKVSKARDWWLQFSNCFEIWHPSRYCRRRHGMKTFNITSICVGFDVFFVLAWLSYWPNSPVIGDLKQQCSCDVIIASDKK